MEQHVSVACRGPDECKLLYVAKVWAQSSHVPAIQWIQIGCEWKQRLGGSRVELDSCSEQCSSWQYLPAYPSSASFLELPPNLVETSGMTEANPLMIEPSKFHGSCSVSGMLKCYIIDHMQLM